MKRQFLSILLVIIFCKTFAQHFDDGSCPYHTSAILYAGDSAGVVALVHGLALIGQDGSIQRTLPIPGNLLGISKWQDGYLAFYITERFNFKDYVLREYQDAIKMIHCVQIDKSLQMTGPDHIVYTNPGSHMLDPYVVNDPAGNFAALVIRIARYEGDGIKGLVQSDENKNMAATSGVKAVFFSPSLEPKVDSLASAAVGSAYLSAYANQYGQLAILSWSKNQLTAEEFGRDGQLQKKLTVAFVMDPIPDDKNDGRRGLFHPGANILTFAIANPDTRSGHRNFAAIAFDFDAEKAITFESEKLNGDFYKRFKNSPALNGSKHFKGVEDLRADGICYFGDTTVICTAIRYEDEESASPNTDVTDISNEWKAEGAIVSLYDRQYHLLHQFFLNRELEGSSFGRGFSYQVMNGKIFALGNEGKARKYSNICFTIDPNSYTLDKRTLYWGSPSAEANGPTDPSNTFWFPHGWVKLGLYGPYKDQDLKNYVFKTGYP